MPAPKTQPFIKYGLDWLPKTSPLAVEFAIISQTDEWRKQNGLTLFNHYKAAQMILWPDHDIHRWSDLALRTMVENDVSVFMGSADSNKTYAMAKFVLTDWWARPTQAIWLVSSTELRGAELRIWGVLKDLFNSARARHRELPGAVLESIHSITNEAPSTDNSEGRLLTEGIVFVPCFPSGTLVDTPSGPRAIESLKVGEMVINAQGVGRITEVHNRIAKQLLRVVLSDGRIIDCTKEHPFFTQEGWKNARDLKYGDRVFSACETMRLMRETPKGRIPRKPEILFDFLPPTQRPNTMRTVRQGIPTIQNINNKSQRSVLQRGLCWSVGSATSTMPQENNDAVQTLWKTHELCSSQQGVLLEKMPAEMGNPPMSSMRQSLHVHSSINSASQDSFLQSVLQEESDRPQVWEKACASYSTRNACLERIPTINRSLPHTERFNPFRRAQALVSTRYSFSRNKTRRGNRRWSSSDTEENGLGCSANKNTSIAWVDHIEILEQGSDPRFDQSKRGYSVHNIEVEGHPSYSVNGVIVHNCKRGGSWIGLGALIGIKPKPGGRLGHCGDETQSMEPVFLDAYSNFVGKEHFKGIMAGNPFDPDDTLCRAAEPVEGWDSWHDTGKTQTWRSKFYNAQVVAFDGRDSPNFDYPPDQPTRYKYLVGRKKLSAVARTHGLDSWQYFMQCVGKPRPGAVARRVITRAMCETYHAFDEVTWLGEPTIKIGACDAAYGGMGGDRCVAGYIEFGKDVNGHVVVACHPFVLVPVKVNRFVLPEDQIANFVRDYMQSVKVEPQNFFFDGRGSLAVAFARLWSPKVEAVEFGGRATERPVSNDTFMWDGDRKTRRLQRCDELYSRFVTELWFAVHMVIISDQMRQLPQDVAAELCRREWDYVQNAKIEIETKADMKERTGESPDLGDTLCVLLEGARRRGFQIARLPGKGEEDIDDAWKMDLRERAQRLKRSYQLTYN